MTTRNKASKAATVSTGLGLYQIAKDDLRWRLCRPSGMFVGWFNTKLLARLGAYDDAAVLRGERY